MTIVRKLRGAPPPRYSGVRAKWRDLLKGMRVGRGVEVTYEGSLQKTQAMIWNAARELGIKAATRKMLNGNLGVWRVE